MTLICATLAVTAVMRIMRLQSFAFQDAGGKRNMRYLPLMLKDPNPTVALKNHNQLRFCVTAPHHARAGLRTDDSNISCVPTQAAVLKGVKDHWTDANSTSTATNLHMSTYYCGDPRLRTKWLSH